MSKAKVWPPMMTRDGKPFVLGGLVYSPEVNLNRRGEDRSKMTIECYRVIEMNLQYRTLRMRCHKGCESFLKISEGCNRDGYYASREAAVDEAQRQAAKQAVEWQREISILERSMKRAMTIKPTYWPEPAA